MCVEVPHKKERERLLFFEKAYKDGLTSRLSFQTHFDWRAVNKHRIVDINLCIFSSFTFLTNDCKLLNFKMRLLIVSLVLLCAVFSQRFGCSAKPYSSQDVDEELAESELEKQEVSYIVSRHRFTNEANDDGKQKRINKKKMRKQLPSDFDDDFFDDFDQADVDVEVETSQRNSDAELQRATTYTNPTVPLEFRDSLKKKPKKKNLNKRRLMKKMGSDFDTTWMSPEIPSSMSSNDGSESVVTIGEDQMAELTRQVTALNLASELKELSASVDEDIPTVSKMVDVFEQWLVKKSSCPVTYTWTDLGEYFWPRYIKQGKCSGDSGNKKTSSNDSSDEYDYVDEKGVDKTTSTGGCSWPEGMKCVQGESKILHLLRWHCRRRKKVTSSSSSSTSNASNNKRRKCKWYKVPYPVISSCKCACQ